VGVVGSGTVGDALSDGFLKHGWEVCRGTRDPKKLAAWRLKAGAKGSVGSCEDATRFGQVVVLAVKGTAAEEALDLCGPANLEGKTVIDTTNPIADAPPVQGMLTYFTTHADSLMERLQRRVPKARFVKAFSCVGSALMVDPALPGGPPTMFLCGDDPAAKAEVSKILVEFGWEPYDVGGAAGARAIEPLAILWCAPGFLRGDWAHALKMLRP
jgi:predicted dinucleotide-binding enzyme